MVVYPLSCSNEPLFFRIYYVLKLLEREKKEICNHASYETRMTKPLLGVTKRL